jgi:threonine/homoserine/homoserine lactone efflux protein
VLSYLILGVTYAFAAAVQPGQLQAYLISQTLANGWRRTMPAALAPILSDMPIVALVLLVLTRLPRLFLPLLQSTGGVFLLYLAWGAFRATRAHAEATAAPGRPPYRTLSDAVLVNLLNPNPYLGWSLVLGPLLVRAWRQSPATGLAFVAAFYATMVAATASIVLLVALARSAGPRIARALVKVSAVALAGVGVYQLWSGATALLDRS